MRGLDDAVCIPDILKRRHKKAAIGRADKKQREEAEREERLRSLVSGGAVGLLDQLRRERGNP